jgi:hypothetical protein
MRITDQDVQDDNQFQNRTGPHTPSELLCPRQDTRSVIQLGLSGKPGQNQPGYACAHFPGSVLLWSLDSDTTQWGQGMLAAGIRGAMSYYGIVGPFGSYLFMGVRLLIDQTLENWTGVGALPWYVYS